MWHYYSSDLTKQTAYQPYDPSQLSFGCEDAFGVLFHMSEMAPRPKTHPGDTGELEVTLGPYLGNVRGLSLNDLAHHPTIKVFYQAVAFQQSLNHSVGGKPVQ